MQHISRHFHGYRDLAKSQVEGRDYRIVSERHPLSRVSIIAPHGGAIESFTSEVAVGIAKESFSLYLFEGIRSQHNYHALHLTSHKFDEPRCLGLVADSDWVVALHGCKGVRSEALLGGLDHELLMQVGRALENAGITVRRNGHAFPAIDPLNICNRGRRGIGVQIEMTTGLRHGRSRQTAIQAIRGVLLKLEPEN